MIDFIPAKILPGRARAGESVYLGRGDGFILRALARIGIRTIFAMPDPANASLIFAARRLRRREGADAPRLRILEPACDGAFETIRFSFESEEPPVVWLSGGPAALSVLPAVRVAQRSRVPLLLVSPSPDASSGTSQTTPGLPGHRRLIRHADLFQPFCKTQLRIEGWSEVQAIFAEARELARSETAGPIHIEIDAKLLSRWTARRLRNPEELKI
ncbi:MAG: thiamine pyrophosphate-binding protein [bacterium]|nr:thiamine pyrophosphate-binding protein [bacterium]